MTEKPEKPEKTVCMDNIVDDVENCFYSVKSKPIYTLSLFIFWCLYYCLLVKSGTHLDSPWYSYMSPCC